MGRPIEKPGRIVRVDLTPHRDSPETNADWISVTVSSSDGIMVIQYDLTGCLQFIKAPAWDHDRRADEIWRSTCFEAFFQNRSGGYREYNFAPDGRWAAYEFDGYRDGMRVADVRPPEISVTRSTGRLVLEARIDCVAGSAAFSSVIEDIDGVISYWALAHPPGKPDFHHPDSFVLTLPFPEPA